MPFSPRSIISFVQSHKPSSKSPDSSNVSSVFSTALGSPLSQSSSTPKSPVRIHKSLLNSFTSKGRNSYSTTSSSQCSPVGPLPSPKNGHKYPSSPVSSTVGSTYSTAVSSIGSPLPVNIFDKSATLPLSPSDAYAIWGQAAYFFHRRHYSRSLVMFKHLVTRPGISTSIRRRLHINIGLIHLALRTNEFAAKAFHEATTLRDSWNDEFTTSADVATTTSEIISSYSGAVDITALAVFLLGIANWELGDIKSAQTYFDSCVDFFGDDSIEYASESFERCMRYISFEPLGMAFILDIGQARRNSRLCTEQIKLQKCVPVKAIWDWDLHRLSEDAIFEADEAVLVRQDSDDGVGSGMNEESCEIMEAPAENRAEEHKASEDKPESSTTAGGVDYGPQTLDMEQVWLDGAPSPLTGKITTIHPLRKQVRFSDVLEIIPDAHVSNTTRARPVIYPPAIPMKSRRRSGRRPLAEKALPVRPMLPLIVEGDAKKMVEIEMWLALF